MRKALKPEMDAVRDAVYGYGYSERVRCQAAQYPEMDLYESAAEEFRQAQEALLGLLEADSIVVPTADVPPVLTRRVCQGGPECTHPPGSGIGAGEQARGRYVCACEWPARQDPVPTTCVQSMGDRPRAHKLMVDSVGWRALDYERCALCPLCEWEQDVLRWEYVRTGMKIERPQRRERRHAYPSADAAITAYAGFGGVSRVLSALGGIVDALARGQVAPAVKQHASVPILDRLDDVIAVEKAVKRAYARSASEWFLAPATCEGVLMGRVHGTNHDHLAEQFAIPVKTVKHIVRTGRRRVAVELAAREVIPMPGGHTMCLDVEARRREILR